METRLLTRSDVEQLIVIDELDLAMRKAFVDYSKERVISGKRYFSRLTGPGDMMILAPGLAPDIPAYSVKVHAKFPEQIPGIRGALLLNDLQTGALLAIMDSTYLTAVRTGLSAAIATDILSRQDARTVAVIGAGTQGRFQLRYLCHFRRIEKVKVYDTSAENAQSFAEQMKKELNTSIDVCDSLESAVQNCDILLSATWSTQPFLSSNNVPIGCHITTLGADQPHEAELTAELIQQSQFICDDRDLAVSMGAIGGAGLQKEWINAELGEVISGIKPGRINDKQITVYGAVGVAFQDLITAWHVYEKAEKQDVGSTMDFLG